MYRVEEVHPAEVFRTLQHARQFADWNGGGVRGQHGLRTNLVFRFRQHRFFDFRILDDGFDYHVDTVETAVFQHGLNGGDHTCKLQPVNFSAFQLFIQQLGRFGHAQRQGFLADVFHHHVFSQLFGFTLHELIVEEDTDQRAGFIGVRQRDKALIFELQRLVASETSSRFNGFHRRDRRRVVFTRRLHDHAFGDGEAHGGFNFAEF